MATTSKGKAKKARKLGKGKALPKKGQVASKAEADAFNEGMEPEGPKTVKVGKAATGGKKAKATGKVVDTVDIGGGFTADIVDAPKTKPIKGRLKSAKATRAPGEKKEKKVSLLDAAATVLGMASTPKEGLQSKAIVEKVLAEKLWEAGAGLTPAATLNAAMHKEIAAKGKDSRFTQVSKGHFASNK